MTPAATGESHDQPAGLNRQAGLRHKHGHTRRRRPGFRRAGRRRRPCPSPSFRAGVGKLYRAPGFVTATAGSPKHGAGSLTNAHQTRQPRSSCARGDGSGLRANRRVSGPLWLSGGGRPGRDRTTTRQLIGLGSALNRSSARPLRQPVQRVRARVTDQREQLLVRRTGSPLADLVGRTRRRSTFTTAYRPAVALSHLSARATSRRYRAITSCATHGGMNGWNLLKR
jgi:hypothetical protein